MTSDIDFAFVYGVAQVSTWFFIYSFAGWFYEVVIGLFQHHRFVNRGFVLGPVCPIYGFGALFAIAALRPLNNPALQLAVGFVAAGILEYGTSWIMEKLFHARWWDYSDIPLNLNGRICLIGLIIFTVLMLAVDLVFQPAIDSVVALVSPGALILVAMAANTAFAVDLTSSIIHMRGFAEKVGAVQSRIQALSDKVRETVSTVSENALATLPDVETLTNAARESLASLDKVRLVLKDSVAGIKGSESDNDESLRQLVDLKVLEEFKIQVREALGRGWSLYERKSLGDPRFRFTQYTDAYEWAKSVLPFLKDGEDHEGENEGAASR